MTKKELWAAYVAKNPSFAGDGNITMSARGLRKLFDQTWDAGFNRHMEADQLNRAMRGSFGASTGCNPLGDIFK